MMKEKVIGDFEFGVGNDEEAENKGEIDIDGEP